MVDQTDEEGGGWSLKTIYEVVPKGWWTREGTPYALTYDENQEVITNADGPVYRPDAWDTAV